MASNTRRKLEARKRVNPDQVRERILEVFSEKSKRLGIRALIMTELATELRMSATTLYKLFPSKEALALACVDRWADELSAAEATKRASDRDRDRDQRNGSARSGFDRYLQWIDAWADANADLSPAFARDLRTDYPAVWRRYREVMEERKRRGAELLRPMLKPDVDERLAFALLNEIFSTVLEPEFADKLHISRREALRTAVSIWAGGALARPNKLLSLRGGKHK